MTNLSETTPGSSSELRQLFAGPFAQREREIASRLISLKDIDAPVEAGHLVQNWLGSGGLSVAYGDSNVGKTFFALDLALHVAAGASWHGAVIESGPVVYLAAEGGCGILNRLYGVKLHRPELFEAALDGGFHCLPSSMDICSEREVEALLNVVAPIPPTLIVIDTLGRTMASGDENSARDMGDFVRALDRIRISTQAHIMVLHHSGKAPSKGARGSSALRAAVDTEIELARKGDLVLVEATKQRDLPSNEKCAFYLQPISIAKHKLGVQTTSALVHHVEHPRDVKKPGEQAKAALDALDSALLDGGILKLTPNGQTKCVSEAVWRSRCFQLGLSNGVSESANRKAFQRAKEKLLVSKLIMMDGDFVWKPPT